MKHIITLLFVLFISISSFAQRGTFSGAQLGINLGGGVSTILPEHNYGGALHEFKSPFFGISGGVEAAFMWRDAIGVQIGLNYTQKGQSYTANFGTASPFKSEKDVVLNYMQIPITYRHVIPTDYYSSVAPNFYFISGVQTEIITSTNVTYKRDGAEVTFVEGQVSNNFTDVIEEPEKDEDLFTQVAFSLVGGIGFEFPLENGMMLTLEKRGELGLSDINSPDYRYPHPEFGYRKSRTYALNLKVGLIYFIRP